jgi:hypothetical protein
MCPIQYQSLLVLLDPPDGLFQICILWRRLREEYSSYSFWTSVLDRGELSASRPGRALPPGKEPPVPIVQETGWAPEPVWLEENPLPLPGIDLFRICGVNKDIIGQLVVVNLEKINSQQNQG